MVDGLEVLEQILEAANPRQKDAGLQLALGTAEQGTDTVVAKRPAGQDIQRAVVEHKAVLGTISEELDHSLAVQAEETQLDHNLPHEAESQQWHT